MRFLSILTILCFVTSNLSAADPAQQRGSAIERGIEYLLKRGQADDGTFSSQTGTAITGLVVAAILENRPTAAVNDAGVQKSVKYLLSNVRPDGGIYALDSRHRNYETCVGLMALALANHDKQHDDVISNAEKFLRGLQWDEGEGLETSDLRYGGAGYGGQNRPDMSNTSFFIEALRQLGRGGDDEAIQKAMIFVSRSQNLESSYNTSEFAPKVNDGGFYYTPAAGGQSFAGKTANGGLRSYGSMTYAGLKSMIYAGVTADDPRVKAALEFIKANYSVEENPGMGTAGLYYYYQTFAKAMQATGKSTLTDAAGVEHVWATEIIEELSSRQNEDGSWINGENERWMEADANLVTAYAVLTLKHCELKK